jgi:phosphatidylinositol alpha-1,6-mannosyltransferase
MTETYIGPMLLRSITFVMPKKILFLTLRTFSFTGGIEKICRSIAKAFYSLENEKQITMQTYSIYDAPSDLDTRYIPETHFKGFNGNRLRFIFQAIFQGLKCDKIILSHINLLPAVYVIKLLAPKSRIILFAHGIELWRPIRNWERRFLLKQCQQIWAVSDYTAKQIERVHKIPASYIRILNNCIDPFFIPPNEFVKPKHLMDHYNLTAEQPVLLTLTRLSSTEAYKGYNHVIECLPTLIKEYPDIKYLIAGKADDIEQERLHKLIAKKKLQNHVLLVGFIPENELSSIFRLADIFIMPSKKEGFGIVFIEAAACGCKIIAGNHDGSPDALLNGRLGKLINPDDTDDMILSISDGLKKPRSKKYALDTQSLSMASFNFNNYIDNIKLLLSCE